MQQVYNEERSHIMQLQIKKDDFLKPHHATTDAFLLVVEGAIAFKLRDENFHLHKGDMLSFKKNETHSLQAMEDSMVLIIK